MYFLRGKGDQNRALVPSVYNCILKTFSMLCNVLYCFGFLQNAEAIT